MSGKKGMIRYTDAFKQKVKMEYENGLGINELSRKYAVSRYSVQNWCGLRKKVELRRIAPLPKGRPRIKPNTQEQIIKQLKMENELLRNFLSAVGRK